MREVGAFEAKNKLGHLLDLVEQGEEVKSPAWEGGRALGASAPHPKPGASARRLRRIRKRAEQRKFGPFDWAEWKSYRDQGRP